MARGPLQKPDIPTNPSPKPPKPILTNPLGGVSNPAGVTRPKKKPKRTKPVQTSPLGGTKNPAQLRVPKKTTSADVVRRDINKPTKTKDTQALLKRYGFLNAQRIQDARKIAEGARIDRMVTPLGPGPAPGPSVRDQLQALVGSILYPTPSQSVHTPVSFTPSQRAAIGGADLAVRPLEVWGYSAAQAAMHPGTTIGDVRQFASGTAKALGAIAYAVQAQDPKVIETVAKATLANYVRQYGPDWKKAARQDPLFNLMDAAAVGSGGARLLSIARDMPELGLKGAWKASFHPDTAGRYRTVTDEYGRTQQFRYGSSPIMRAVQDGYDAVSHRLPGRVSLGEDFKVGVPGSASRRVARQIAKDSNRLRRRDTAKIAPYVDFVQKPAVDFAFSPGAHAANDVGQIRLFYEAQLPPELRNNEGLGMIRDALSRERDQAAEFIGVSEHMGSVANADELRKVTLLTERIQEIDAAMKFVPNERYAAALDAVDELTAIVEDFHQRGLDAAKQAENADKFASRRDRFAQWVVHGIDPGTEGAPAMGVTAFMPHRRASPKGSGVSAGFNPRTGTIVTPSDASRLRLDKFNNLDLMRMGEIAPDPTLLVRHANAAIGISVMDTVRDSLWQIGVPVPMGNPLPQHGFLIRDRNAPAPDRFFNNLSSEDAKAVERAMNEYRADTIADLGNDRPDVLVAGGWARKDEHGNLLMDTEGVRWVPEDAVNQLVHFLGGADARRMRGRATKAGQAIDVTENLVKIALLYSNPGYYAANLFGNMVFLALQSDPVRGGKALIDAARLHKNDPRTWTGITTEMGEGIAASLISDASGDGILGKALAGQHRIAQAAGVADRGPRVAAWIYEARQRGYKTPEDWKALLESDSPDAVQMKNTIQEAAAQQMVDFDQLTPLEKTYLRRLIFIYPWIRGSVAWSAKFAASKPAKTALLGAAGNAAAQVSDKNLGAPQDSVLPSFLNGAFVGKSNGRTARVVNAASVSPFGTLGNVLQTLSGDTKYDIPYDLIHPLIQSGIRVLQGQDAYGRHVGVGKSARNEAVNLIPGFSTNKYLLDPGSQSKVYDNQGRLVSFARRATRVGAFDVNLAAAKKSRAGEQRPGKAGNTERLDLQKWQKDSADFAAKVGLDAVPPRIVAARKAKYDYQMAQKRLLKDLNLKSLGGDNAGENQSELATERRQAALKIAVLRTNARKLGLDPKIADVMENALKQNKKYEVVREINNDLDGLLGFNDLSSWDSDVRQSRRAA